MMMCSEPEGVMDQEAQYLAALQSAAKYQIEGNVLQLRTRMTPWRQCSTGNEQIVPMSSNI